jgi:hypothetical protein
MASGDIFRINSPKVIDEIFDDEVVIINLDSGSYYSADRTGLEIWREIKRGAGASAIVAALTAKYEGDAAEIDAACRRFLAELRQESLIVSTNDAPEISAEVAANRPSDAGAKFSAPALHKYTDMQELLLLDPIHEVDESGWPHASAEAHGVQA